MSGGFPTEVLLLSPRPESDEAFEELRERLEPTFGSVPVRVCRGDGQEDPPPRSGAALIAGGQPGTGKMLQSIVERHTPDSAWPDPGWSWVHLTSSGADPFTDWLPIPGDPLLTCGRGVNARSVAEWCLAAMLHFLRDFGHYQEAARERRWDRRWAREVGGKILVVVGAGRAGAELAKLATALGMRTVGVSRSGRPLEGFEWVVAMDRLAEVLGTADVTVVLLPLTPDTRGSVGADRIAGLKAGSLLLVASRGGIVDEEAVLQAVRSGHLAGAAFDVFEEEPLPADSPLWGEPGILLTPHVAGTTDRFMERTAEVVARIWHTWRRTGEPSGLSEYRYDAGAPG